MWMAHTTALLQLTRRKTREVLLFSHQIIGTTFLELLLSAYFEIHELF